MYKTLILFLLIFHNALGQNRIGKTEGAEIVLNEDYYEVIFETTDNKFSSFYIQKGVEGKDGLSTLKKYIFLLFKNRREEDFLLQFIGDSVLLIYKDDKVQMVKWIGHYSDKREYSKWLSFSNFLELFGLASKKEGF